MSGGAGEWRRHDGGACPVKQTGTRIQWRAIGSNHAKILRAGQHDWSMTFEWRYAA